MHTLGNGPAYPWQWSLSMLNNGPYCPVMPTLANGPSCLPWVMCQWSLLPTWAKVPLYYPRQWINAPYCLPLAMGQWPLLLTLCNGPMVFTAYTGQWVNGPYCLPCEIGQWSLLSTLGNGPMVLTTLGRGHPF